MLETDLDLARHTALAAIDQLPQIETDPAPKALMTDVSSGSVLMELRFWSGSTQLETIEARHAVINAVVPALRSSGIKLADGTLTLETGPALSTWLAAHSPK